MFFERDFTQLYSDWHPWAGMQASNLHFTSVLPGRRSFGPSYTQSADCFHESPWLPLDFEDGGGTSDT